MKIKRPNYKHRALFPVRKNEDICGYKRGSYWSHVRIVYIKQMGKVLA